MTTIYLQNNAGVLSLPQTNLDPMVRDYTISCPVACITTANPAPQQLFITLTQSPLLFAGASYVDDNIFLTLTKQYNTGNNYVYKSDAPVVYKTSVARFAPGVNLQYLNLALPTPEFATYIGTAQIALLFVN